MTGRWATGSGANRTPAGARWLVAAGWLLSVSAISVCARTAAAGAGGAAMPANVDWSETRVVTLTMAEYRFDPDHLAFRHGVPYRLHLVNTGTEIHDFTASEFFRAIAFRDADALGSYGASVVMKPRTQKDIDFVAIKPGSYPMRCADHDWAGMAGMITVE